MLNRTRLIPNIDFRMTNQVQVAVDLLMIENTATVTMSNDLDRRMTGTTPHDARIAAASDRVIIGSHHARIPSAQSRAVALMMVETTETTIAVALSSMQTGVKAGASM